MRGADGEPFKKYGKEVVKNWMGSLCFNHMCVVVDMVDKVLLEEIFCCVIPLIQPTLSSLRKQCCLKGPLYH